MPYLRRFRGGGVTSSLLAFKIKAKDLGEGLKSDKIKIEIKLYSFESIISTLELTSWNSIKQASEIGWASEFFKVGDEKTITLTTSEGVTEEVTLVILGFDHDDLTSGGKAGITFGMKNLLAGTYKMNNSDTNKNGWNGCLMRTTHMKTFFGQLPNDLQSVIKKVNKKATAGNKSYDIVTSQDKLFLFSQREIDGTSSTGYKDEGTRYEYYKSASKVKKLSNGSSSTGRWWLRSPHISSSNLFRCFYIDGSIYDSNAYLTHGVCFGFCV